MSKLVYNTVAGHVCGEGCGCPTTNKSVDPAVRALALEMAETIARGNAQAVREIAATRGVVPVGNATYNEDPHQASKQAGAASMATAHGAATKHAGVAIRASQSGDRGAAAAAHLKAANLHEKAAVSAYGNRADAEGDEHMNAAASHRRASSMHRSLAPDDAVEDNADREDLAAPEVDRTAPARGESLAKVPSRPVRGDVQTTNADPDSADAIKARILGSRNDEQWIRERLAQNQAQVIVRTPGDSTREHLAHLARQPYPGVPTRSPQASGMTVNASDTEKFQKYVQRSNYGNDSIEGIYDSPAFGAKAVFPGSPNYDGRGGPTRETLRAGLTDSDSEDVEPRLIRRGDEQQGRVDSEATAAGRMGIGSYDSHEDIEEYADVIQPRYLGRNQAVVGNAERQWNALEPVGRTPSPPVQPFHLSQPSGFALNITQDSSLAGVSASMVAYLRKYGMEPNL